MCAESHTVNSGFGRYTQEVLSRLSKSNKYELAELACYLKDGSKANVPWKVYPNAPKDDDKPNVDVYNNHPLNQFGQWRFEKVLLDFKPDIVFDIRDYWMFSYQEVSCLRPYFKWIIAPTIDSIPQKTEWLKTFENADIVLTHTDWAGNYLRSLNRKINIGPCITDSVDTQVFQPINHTKTYHKSKYGLPPDSIIIGSVMRNQKRKLIAELFKVLRKLIDTTNNHNIYLYLHTSYPEKAGWPIPELLQEHGVENNVLFTYYSVTDNNIFVSKYKGPKILSPTCDNGLSIFPNVSIGVNNTQLCDIYNLFDIYVQYAICEGLGIPQLEAASCGIPLFSVNYSGMEEIVSKVNGVKINNLLATELETGSDRATPDNDHLVSEILNWMNKSKKEKLDMQKMTRELLVQNYSWDMTTNIIMDIFDSIDIDENIWSKPMITNATKPVPDNLSDRQFIEFIISDIICEPNLLNTYFSQNLIRSLNESVDIVNVKNNPQARQEIVKALEIFLNNKVFCEKVRSGEIKLTDDFLS